MTLILDVGCSILFCMLNYFSVVLCRLLSYSTWPIILEMEKKLHTLSLPPSLPPKSSLLSLKVQVGDQVQKGTVMATYGAAEAEGEGSSATLFKSAMMGKVRDVLRMEGDSLRPK